jgi:hypothetical protein
MPGKVRYRATLSKVNDSHVAPGTRFPRTNSKIFDSIMAATQILAPYIYPPIQSTAVSIEYLGNEYVLPRRDTGQNPNLKKFGEFKIDAMLIQ